MDRPGAGAGLRTDQAAHAGADRARSMGVRGTGEGAFRRQTRRSRERTNAGLGLLRNTATGVRAMATGRADCETRRSTGVSTATKMDDSAKPGEGKVMIETGTGTCSPEAHGRRQDRQHFVAVRAGERPPAAASGVTGEPRTMTPYASIDDMSP